MRFAIPLLFLLTIPFVSALQVNMNVKPDIRGNLGHFEFNTGPVQSFKLTWENTGSVGCDAQARVDIFKGTDFIYQVWSERSEIPPGRFASWNLYSNLDEGNYTFYITVDHCYERFTFGPYNLTVRNSSRESDFFDIRKISNTRDSVTLSVKSKQDTGRTVILAKGFPRGWRFQSLMLPKLEGGEPETVTLHYRPSIWKEEKVVISVAGSDGNRTTREIYLKNPPTLMDWLIFVLRFIF